jgi:hypothetical protein
MPRRIAPFIAALLVCDATLAQSQSEIRVVERREIAMPATTSYRLTVTLVQMEDSGWTRERSIRVFVDAMAILQQCDIGVARADWINLSAPSRYLDFSTPVARELAKLHPLPRPAVYFVRDTRSRPAFDAEAIGRGNSRTRPELADTVWITVGTKDPGIALAHELAHVLLDSGEHTDEPGNLMHDQTSGANTKLSVTQCARMRETARKNGLLER